jgi:hypothetical protein
MIHSGIAVRGSGITVEKNSVRISELQKITRPHPGTVGIGHTPGQPTAYLRLSTAILIPIVPGK